MFPLTKLFAYNDSPISYLFSTLGLTIVKHLAWYGLVPDIRRGYIAAINSYNSFYTFHNKKSWLISMNMLEEWAVTRIYRSMLPKQGQIKSNTIISYLLAFNS